MTSQPGSYPDLSDHPTKVVASSARPHTEPLRELCVLALLVGNGVFLFLGFSRLIFVIDGWGSDFGQRCAAQYGAFVGPIALGLPVLAMLLTTHVSPLLRRTRIILITVLSELSVSALFGAITYLGAFAFDLGSARATIEGLLERSVWLGFLVIAVILAIRVLRGLFPPAKPGPAGHPGYAPPTYGRPYPGQPLYPQGTYQPGIDEYLESVDPFQDSGWPVVPPPPRPAPLVVETAGDLTVRVTPLLPAQSGDAGDLTQRMPAPSASPAPSVSPAPQVANPTPATDPVGADPTGA